MKRRSQYRIKVQKDFFWKELLIWHETNNRNDLPWRCTNDAFHILIAEFLLQQTHMRTVGAVYHQILRVYPQPELMAEGNLADLEELVRPLGLHYRAQRLKQCSQVIGEIYNGEVPRNREELLALPGVGEYISDAVLCYAFGEPTVPIDTNVLRLFTRYFGFTSVKTRPRTDKTLVERIRSLYGNFQSTREANLAVLDFAAAVCRPKPVCLECCLKAYCCYHSS